jgi:G6PDH family F420-dependent oxidoreductase
MARWMVAEPVGRRRVQAGLSGYPGHRTMKLGFFLSCEEYGPRELVEQAVAAERAGFSGLWISDHYHPWNHEQGQSPFVWSVIGALAGAGVTLPVTTAVTCPTVRIHPAVVAQAAATSSVLLGGRFTLGVGTGEALNEHILGDAWPEADVRIEMLEEAIEVMRALWSGQTISHRGRHYRVEHAKLFTVPEEPPRVLVSGFGPKAVDMAGRLGDGFVTTSPDAESIDRFKEAAGDKLVQAGAKVSYAPDPDEAAATAHRIWSNDGLPGELAQILPTPEHFEQAAELVTPEMLAETLPCGPDLEAHVASFEEYAEAGVDELYVQQIGGRHDEFFAAYARDVIPHFESVSSHA